MSWTKAFNTLKNFVKPSPQTVVTKHRGGSTTVRSSSNVNKNLNKPAQATYNYRVKAARSIINDLIKAKGNKNLNISSRKFNKMVKDLVDGIDADPTILSNERKFNKLMDSITAFQSVTNASAQAGSVGKEAIRSDNMNKKEQQSLDELKDLIEGNGSVPPGGSSTIIG